MGVGRREKGKLVAPEREKGKLGTPYREKGKGRQPLLRSNLRRQPDPAHARTHELRQNGTTNADAGVGIGMQKRDSRNCQKLLISR